MASFGYIEVVLAVSCFVFLWLLQNYNNSLPWNWPFVGMLPTLLYHIQTIHESCLSIAKRAGGTFMFKGIWFTNMDMLLTVDPANIHYIMSENFENFPKGPKFKEFFEVLGDGIFNSDLDSWKKQRKLARTLINHQNFYKYLVKTSQDKVKTGLIPVLEYIAKNSMIVDLQDVFQRLTFDTTCIFVTGYDPGCLTIELKEVPFSKAMDEAEEAIFKRHIVPEWVWKFERWLNIRAEKKMHNACEVLDDVIGNYISKKREDLKKEAFKDEKYEEGFDLLTSYLKESSNMDMKCDDKFLRDTVLNLMIAGRDTTSSALTWLIWLVSTHPQIEKKILEEIKSIIPSEEAEKFRVFNVEETNKLVYLHGAICDSLRLYPPVPFQHKAPVKPDTLPSGHRVDPTMKVMFSLYAMGRMESIWGKDCLEFKPERWISERGSIKHEPSYKFLAFNAGPRTCLGKDVAFTQLKVVAATIIHNYQINVVQGHQINPNLSVILYIQNGLKVRINKRRP